MKKKISLMKKFSRVADKLLSTQLKIQFLFSLCRDGLSYRFFPPLLCEKFEPNFPHTGSSTAADGEIISV